MTLPVCIRPLAHTPATMLAQLPTPAATSEPAVTPRPSPSSVGTGGIYIMFVAAEYNVAKPQPPDGGLYRLSSSAWGGPRAIKPEAIVLKRKSYAGQGPAPYIPTR